MMEWLTFSPLVVVATLVVMVPGIAVGAAIRLRGVLLWGFAPAAGVGVIAVSATILGVLGVGWSPWSALACASVLIVLCWATGLLLRPTTLTVRPAAQITPVAVAIIVGACLGAARMASIIGAPDNISQTNDAVFHLNALRFIEESGSASSLDVLGAIGEGGFYPAAWHAIASLVGEITGATAVGAANAASLAIAGPLWALSITSFAFCIARGSRAVAVAAAVMAPALFAFPFYALEFGVLYPYAVATAIVPGVLSVVVALVTAPRPDGATGNRQGTSLRRILIAVTATAIGMCAVALAQPAAMLTWLIGVAALLLGTGAIRWRGASPIERRNLLLGAVGVVVCCVVLWGAMMRLSSSVLWGQQKSAPLALIDLLLNGSAGAGPALAVSALAIVGIVVAVTTRALRWFALYGAVLAVITLVAVSVQNLEIRRLLSPWYADPHRFVMMMPIVVIPLAAFGAAWLVSLMRRRSRRGAIIVALLMAVIVVGETAVWSALQANSSRYVDTPRSFLSADEERLLAELNEYVLPGERVIGNPAAGAAFGYALSGADVVPRNWSMPKDADLRLLGEELVSVAENPLVCDAVAKTGVDYVLDFGDSAAGAGRQEWLGLTGFEDAEGFQKVAQEGDASLWRIVAC